MKKITLCGLAAIALVAAGCSKSNETVEVFGEKCVKVAQFEQGDYIVKCPVAESLVAIQGQTPNAKFVQGGEEIQKYAADTESIYVNVVPAGSYDWAQKDEYRVMVKNPTLDGDAMWAVSVVVE